VTLTAFTDGASRGNPGESGLGVVVRGEDGTVLRRHSRYLGRTTNNVAEYSALLELLEIVRTYPCTRVVVHSDSELMVRQINGEYKVRDPELKRLHARVTAEVHAASFQFELRHIPRSMNAEADRLANAGIDARTAAGGPAEE
jgi:ribonuclease HI